jgi:hypothetical protein
MVVLSRAMGSGGTGAPQVRFHRTRSFVISVILSAATLLASVATVLADGKPGPIPK